MAFVFKSEKNISSIYSNQNKIGNADNLEQDCRDCSKIENKQNYEPFLSSTSKTIESKSLIPGPGAYYKDFQQIKNLKNLIKSQYNQSIDSSQVQVRKNLVYIKETEKLGFDTKSKRFQNIDENKSPGPGYYFPSEKENKIHKMVSNNKLIFIKIKKTNSPQIQKDFSKMILSSSINSDNKCRKTFQYDNYACRPKILDLRKCKQMTEINESKTFGSTTYSDGKILFNDKSSFDKMEIDNSTKFKNTFNYRITFCKKMNNKKPKQKTFIEKIIDNKSPGPGYYFDNIHKNGINAPKPKSEYFQFFGTNTKRFHSLNKAWTKLGPGQYFTFMNRKSQSHIKQNVPFDSQEKRDNTFLCLNNKQMLPGPGDYDVKFFPKTTNYMKSKKYDKKFIFGTSSERFNDKYIMKDQYRYPGPGYYDPKSTSINKLNNNKSKENKGNIKLQLYKLKYDAKLKLIKQYEKEDNKKFLNGVCVSPEEVKYKEKIPPVGYYYPDFYESIDYNNNKKIIESHNDSAPFNQSMLNRFQKSSSTSNIIGPGYYYFNKCNKPINVKNPPFMSSSKRFDLQKSSKIKTKIDFDDINRYNLNQFNQWNKKSFNIYFI